MAKKSAAKKSATRTAARNYTDILYEVKDQVAWITINRPRVLNAFREQTLDEMIDAVKSTREDPSIVCVVFTGAGDKSFSAGGDFYAMKRLNFTNAYMWNDRMLGLAMTIRGLPIPVIAMVNGWCMGGGHELALWCDLVIASENAVLGQTGAKVGACPTVGATQYLPRIIGERLAREMIFCARRFTGEGGGRDRPHQQVRAAEGPAEGDAEVVRDDQGPQRADHPHDQEDRSTSNPTISTASWQHGMELLAHVWGSEESLEGMNAFLAGPQAGLPEVPHAQQARAGDTISTATQRDLNAPPSMRQEQARPLR